MGGSSGIHNSQLCRFWFLVCCPDLPDAVWHGKDSTMNTNSPRLACRAVIVRHGQLLLVNAYSDGRSDLWCAPGGGVEKGQSLPDNLVREVREETGLEIEVGELLGINEFHNTEDGFHQVDLFFRCEILQGEISQDWQDPDAVVTQRRFFAEDELSAIFFKPDFLPALAFQPNRCPGYEGLEKMVR